MRQLTPFLNASLLTVEGRGWDPGYSPWGRLPIRSIGKLRPEVWNRSTKSAGISVRFIATTRNLGLRWRLGEKPDGVSATMPMAATSGIDIYRRSPDGEWNFVANTAPSGLINSATVSVEAFDPTEFMLELPLNNVLQQLELAVDANGVLQPAAPTTPLNKPVVVYGTSIAQGMAASRPGMSWCNRLKRVLDRELINLGFAGQCLLDPSVSDLLAELDPALYIVDCLWNAGSLPSATFIPRLDYLIQSIRRRRATTPILFVGRSHFDPAKTYDFATNRLASTVDRHRRAGVPGLHFLHAAVLFRSDTETTVDGIHPNDIGMSRQATALAPNVSFLLGDTTS